MKKLHSVPLMSELQQAAVQLPAKGASNEKDYVILPRGPFNTKIRVILCYYTFLIHLSYPVGRMFWH